MDAVRVLDPGPVGLEGVLRQAWARYRCPIAITDSHLNGTPDDRMRWFLEAWLTAERLRREGVNLLAVTSWALLGSFDWNSLLTRDDGFYEAGAFDVGDGGGPRPTSLAHLLQHLAGGGTAEAWLEAHPGLARPGWWGQQSRLTLPPYRGREPLARAAPPCSSTSP